MTALILHLSDIHFKAESDSVTSRAKSIACCSFKDLHRVKIVFIVVSGDIAFSGKSSQYEVAIKFFNKIKDFIKEESDVPIKFILSPGNHDCDFSKDNAARKLLLEQLISSSSLDIDSSVIDSCVKPQTDFFSFRETLEDHSDVTDDRLWRSSTFEIDGKSIIFDCLNLSWISQRKEDSGKISFPIHQYKGKESDSSDVRIIVMHHPFNWLNQSVYRSFRVFIRNLGCILITGHEHQSNVGITNEAETDASIYIEGSALQGHEPDTADSAFNIIILDLDKSLFSSTNYFWDEIKYVVNESGSWSSFRALPIKKSENFSINESYREILEDAGAYLKHPNSGTVNLNDIYVYPDLTIIGDERDTEKNINSSKLLSPDFISGLNFLEGDEKSGRTKFLYMLYQEYLDRGFVPLLISGQELLRSTEDAIDRVIDKVFKSQYKESDVDEYKQLQKKEKLLLIDDFDQTPIKSIAGRAEVLVNLNKRFGSVVVSFLEIFEFREIFLDLYKDEGLIVKHYKLKEFGYVMRANLIDKWYSLGEDETIDDSVLLEKRDKAERLINETMSRRVIPSAPLFLLTLLQSLEAGRSSDFHESSLGHYYHFLLVESFENSGVSREMFGEMFDYCNNLAWFYHIKKSDCLSEDDLLEFNEHFSKTWHKVDFKKRLLLLVKARILRIDGDEHTFRYPYIYYYLKGMYMGNNLNDLDMRAYIGHCCKHLYVRDHARTILFLVHHTNDEFVLTSISESLHIPFSNRAAVTFEGDTEIVTQLIKDAPKLTFSGGEPKEHRKKRNELNDKVDHGSDGLVVAEEIQDELSLPAQLTMISKNAEILGQVLKTQYSKIKRPRKRELLVELFNAPLRAIRDLFYYLEKNPNSFIYEIELELAKHSDFKDSNKRRLIAQKAVASLIQHLTYHFVSGASESANSINLLDDVKEVVKSVNTPSFRIIELGIYLSSPGKIPREKIQKVRKDISQDLVAARVVQIMVINRLYMFKTSEQDMQWISSELDIDISKQHAISYQRSKKTRKKK